MSSSTTGSGALTRSALVLSTDTPEILSNPKFYTAPVTSPGLSVQDESESSEVAVGTRRRQATVRTKETSSGDLVMEVVPSPIFDLILSAGLSADTALSVPAEADSIETIQDGSKVYQWVSETRLQALGGNLFYHRYGSVIFTKLALKVPSNSKLELTVSAIAGEEVTSSTEITGATYENLNMDDMLTGNQVKLQLFDNAGNGALIASTFTEYTVNLDNMYEQNFGTGSAASVASTQGVFECSIDVSAYYGGIKLSQIRKNQTTVKAVVTITTAAGIVYTIQMPSCKIQDLNTEPGGISEANNNSFSLKAEPSETISGALTQISRQIPASS